MTRTRRYEKWDRAARYLNIIAQLEAHPEGISAQAIADRIGVSKRTVYRDLQALDLQASIALWSDRGLWGIDRDKAFLPPLKLTLHEALTLFLGARLLARASDERDTAIFGAWGKLARILPPVLAAHLRETADAYATLPENPHVTAVLRTLTLGWVDRRIVQIEYGPSVYDPSVPSRTTRVHPLAIEPSAMTRALYLVAWDVKKNAQRTFKIERIRSASVTPESFDGHDDENVARDLLSAWDVISDQPLTRIVMRVSPAIARRFSETIWHPTQSIEREEDGGLIWRATVSGTAEILSWIVGWGPDAELLEPADLRAKVGTLHAEAAARYR